MRGAASMDCGILHELSAAAHEELDGELTFC